MQHDDVLYLGHILDCARQAREYLHDVTWEQFDENEVLRYAVRYLVQTAGEAARRVSDTTRAQHPEIPWGEIVGMRHRIVHDYIHVDDRLVWQVARVHLQELAHLVEPLVPPEMREPPKEH